MAQYEETAITVIDNIVNSGLSQSTKDSISSIIKEFTATTGSENVKVEDYTGGKASADTVVINVSKDVAVTEDPGAPVIVMSSEATQGANVTLKADAPRTVVASNQADHIVFEGDAAVTVETGGGNDSIVLGNGDNVVNVTGTGDSSVATGTGNDRVVVSGEGKVQVSMVGGNNVVVLASDKAEVSVTGGTGFDQVQLVDDRTNHSFEIVNGKVVMHSESATTLDKVQVVGFDMNGDGKIEVGTDKITVIADNHDKSIVAKMYEIVFDREGDMGGIEYWLGRVDQGDSLEHVVHSFINSTEFDATYASKSNEDFLKDMYVNLAGREPDADGLAYWMNRLESGDITRADVAWSFAESAEASQVMGIDGSNYVIDLF